MVCSVVATRRCFPKTSFSPVAAGHARERAAAPALAAVLAQPRNIYVPPWLGGRPGLVLFFPLRKHPQKGNQRLQQFLLADPSTENEEEKLSQISMLL